MTEIETTVIRLMDVAPKSLAAVVQYVEALANENEMRLWDEWLQYGLDESDREDYLLTFPGFPKCYLPTVSFLQTRHGLKYVDDLQVIQLASELVMWRRAGRPEGYYDREIESGLTYRTSIGEAIVTFYLGGEQ